MIFVEKMEIIQLNLLFKNSQRSLLLSEKKKKSNSEFEIFLEIELLNTIRDFLTV